MTALRALLAGLVDYAGLFPPAALEMAAAVQAYAAALDGGEAWVLGRFVLPAAALDDFEAAAAGLLPRDGGAWRLSALVGPEAAADLEAVAAFNRRRCGRGAVVDAVELKAATAAEIVELDRRIPRGLTAYFEVPIASGPLSELLDALARAGRRAKVRSGGVRGDAFPPPEALAVFIAACARAGVGFKATAGLHHPLRGVHPLTYEPDSPTATMHGFLNLFLAAALALQGHGTAELMQVLEQTRPEAFDWRDGWVEWRGRRIDAEAIAAARLGFACSFGSCSFSEPIEDLERLGLL